MAPDERGDGKGADSPVDIISFVQEVHRFSALVEPLEFLWTTLSDLRQWKSPNTTLAVWLICNFVGLVFTRGTVFVFVALVIVLIAGVSMFHINTRILDKVLPLSEEDAETDFTSDPDNAAGTMQAVKEFRISLIQMYVILEQFNQSLISFYSLLKWDHMQRSLKFHVGVCLSLICLTVLPVRWNFLLLSNGLLLSHHKVHSYLMNHGLDKVQTILQEKSGLSVLFQGGSMSDKEKTPTQQNSPEDAVDSPEKDDISLSDGEFDMGSSESGNESDSKIDPSTPSKPGVVSRLLEFKRRKQQMMTGHCHGCKASFASIIKRRHCCMQCGHHFCAKCCSQKVPRSTFGATAPAAQTETVPVCSACFTLLSSSKEGKT